MGDYLALCWPAADEAAAARAQQASRHLAAEAAWTAAGTQPGLAIWTRGSRPPQVRKLADGGGFVVGDVFARAGAPPVAWPAERGPLFLAQALCREAWGAYVALLSDPARNATHLFRDPSGGLEALWWRRDGLTVATSALRLAPPMLRPRRLAVDWSRLAVALAAPAAFGVETPLAGLTVVEPGRLDALVGSGDSAVVWSPAAFARRPLDPEDAAAGLPDLVDASVAALVSRHERVIVEVSGGLDSAIVATSLAAMGGAGKVATWLNYYGDRPEGDERAYAEAVAVQLGARLSTVAKVPRALEEADFAELADRVRPALNGLDVDRDRDGAARIAASGATAVLSGQGGDAVFFQMPTAAIAREILATDGLKAFGSPELAAIARRLRVSVWELLAEARRPPAQGELASMVSPLVARDVVCDLANADHPWVREARDLGPAKQLHVRGVASAQVYLGDCRRRDRADLVFPLLSQPVVEHCLAIPARVLGGGDRDRAFARGVFAGRLPAAVLGRRAKGDLTAFYGRLATASLGFLRPHLLDGSLCESGLLDRQAVEALLDPERLIWEGRAGPLLAAAATESWLRHWQRYVPDAGRRPFCEAAES